MVDVGQNVLLLYSAYGADANFNDAKVVSFNVEKFLEAVSWTASRPATRDTWSDFYANLAI